MLYDAKRWDKLLEVPTIEVLRRARLAVEMEWSANGREGPCAMLAITRQFYGSDRMDKAEEALDIFKRVIGEKHIVEWNDRQTQASVVRAFDRAIDLAGRS